MMLGYQASYSETSCDFFFNPTDRPNIRKFDAKQKRGDGLTRYIRLCKYRKKVCYCFYKLTLSRKIAKLFLMALIKREIRTSREVVYAKACSRNQ